MSLDEKELSFQVKVSSLMVPLATEIKIQSKLELKKA